MASVNLPISRKAPGARVLSVDHIGAPMPRPPWSHLPPVTPVVVHNLGRIVQAYHGRGDVPGSSAALAAFPMGDQHARFFPGASMNVALTERERVAEATGCAAAYAARVYGELQPLAARFVFGTAACGCRVRVCVSASA
jgi:hypothetical protein